jgi:outer membrane protein insertion porin family/translocation and assembly module TamA
MRALLPGLRVVVLGCLYLGALTSAAYAQSKVNSNPIETPEIKHLALNGVTSVDPLDLEASIASVATQCRNVLYWPLCRLFGGRFVKKEYLDRDEIARDMVRIRVYYWRRGFRAAEVDTTITKVGDNAVDVAFNIVEHEPTIVRKIEIAFDSVVLRESRVRRITLLKAGDPFDLVKLDSMRIAFANEMWSEGHSDATVDTVVTIDDGRRLADIKLTLIPNHTTFVGNIVVNGLEKVSRQTVLNSITMRTGDLFRASDVLESQRNLFESNLFRLAAVEVPPQFDSVKTVTITVAESPLHEGRVGAGVTNIEFVQTDAKYTAFNLFGGARRLDVNATVGNILGEQLAGHGFFYNPESVIDGAGAGKYLQPTWAASVDFRQPAFLHRPKNQAGFSAFAHRRSTPGIFIDRGYGGAVTLTNQVRVRAPVSLTYRYEVNRVDAGDVYFCVNYGVCEAKTIDVLRAHQSLSPLALDGFIDRSDDPLDPTRGYQARANLEHASRLTLSDYGYSRAFLDVAVYNHYGPSNAYGGHIRGGFIRTGIGPDDVLHPRKLFYAGGANSVRGFPQNQLGPRVLTVAPDRLEAVGCTPANFATTCDPDAVFQDSLHLDDGDFKSQPVGGTGLIEWSAEFRRSIGFRRKLWAAAFVDGAVVSSNTVSGLSSLRNIVKGQMAMTPGVGIRYKSPVGPVRIDIGYDPTGPEELPVITETIVNGERRIIRVGEAGDLKRKYHETRSLLDRFQLHFSIGQPW